MGVMTLVVDLLTLKLAREQCTRVASKVGNLQSEFGHAIGLWVLEVIRYVRDGRTDEQ